MEFPLSWLERLDAEKAKLIAQSADPWRMPLERLRGEIGVDGLERVTSQTVLDILGIPVNRRGPAATRRVVRLMSELGWTATRVRGLRRGTSSEQVRGYVRPAKPSRPSLAAETTGSPTA
jgi:hypothetical protein